MTLINFEDDFLISGEVEQEDEGVRAPVSDVPAESPIQAKFEEFHRLNPWVYERFETMTREYLARGYTKVGIAMLFEVTRWQHNMSTRDPATEFKLSNSYRSRYSRLLIANHPEWATVFETRELREVVAVRG